MSSLVHVSSSILVLSAPFIPHPIMRGTSSIQTPTAWQQQMHRSSITSHGTKDIQLRFAGHTYSCSFRLAQVTQPLLGADFLAHHHLLVDVAGQRLLVADSYSTTPLSISPTTHIRRLRVHITSGSPVVRAIRIHSLVYTI